LFFLTLQEGGEDDGEEVLTIYSSGCKISLSRGRMSSPLPGCLKKRKERSSKEKKGGVFNRGRGKLLLE